MVRISDERLRKNHSRTASPNFESSTDAPVKGFEFRVIDQTGWYRGLIARPSGITFFYFQTYETDLIQIKQGGTATKSRPCQDGFFIFPK